MNPFEEDEKKGRDKFLDDCNNSKYDIEIVLTEIHSPIDAFATAHTRTIKTYAVEIKNRNIPVGKYKKDGLILEKKKYDNLMKAFKLSGYTPLYINYFQDERLVWDIRKIEPIVIQLPCTKTTAEDYKKEIVDKDVILLRYEDAINHRLYN